MVIFKMQTIKTQYKMKKLGLFLIVILIISCDSQEMLKQQISKKKDKVNQLSEEIAQLEEQIVPDHELQDDRFQIPVSVKEMKPESFRHFIDITGNVEAENDAFISPEINGQIKKIHVREGERVTKGQLLISLKTDVTEKMIAEVKTGLELAAKLYEKQSELWKQQIGSELQYLESKNAREQAEARLETLEAQIEMAKIRAPFDGIVESILLKEGELAVPGMQLLHLVDLKHMKVNADISERYLGDIEAGDEVIISFPDLDNLERKASISRVGNVVDRKSRTFIIEMKLDNYDEILKPNMFSIIRVNDYTSQDAFVLPSLAIKQDIRGSYVFIARLNSDFYRARKVYIEPGLSYNDKSVILEGISKDDKVIIEGYDQVSEGVRISIKD